VLVMLDGISCSGRLQIAVYVPTRRTVPGGSLFRSSSFDSEKACRHVAMIDGLAVFWRWT
jgi:hypothetical protein